jgi:hypothetical protein
MAESSEVERMIDAADGRLNGDEVVEPTFAVLRTAEIFEFP